MHYLPESLREAIKAEYMRAAPFATTDFRVFADVVRSMKAKIESGELSYE